MTSEENVGAQQARVARLCDGRSIVLRRHEPPGYALIVRHRTLLRYVETYLDAADLAVSDTEFCDRFLTPMLTALDRA